MYETLAPKGLYERILAKIQAYKAIALTRRKLSLAVLIVGLALIAGVPLWRALAGDLARTGLMRYLSLMVSDFGIVADNWQDYLLGFLESFPTISTIGVLAVVLLLLLGLRYSIKYAYELKRFFAITKN